MAIFKMQDDSLTVETNTQTAVFSNGIITSLVSKITGERYIETDASETGACLDWSNGDKRLLDRGTVDCSILSENRAEFIYHSWYGDGVTYISADDETGDILIRASATSGRPGVKGCGFNIKGIDAGLYALLPLYQGIRLKLGDPLCLGHTYEWPRHWEMGLVIFENDNKDGFWVHCRDSKYLPKRLAVGGESDPRRITLFSDAYGPLDNNKSAGGVTWRINVYSGGWRIPAKIYKDWYYKTFDIEKEKARRSEWLRGIKMALCWANSDTAVLDAVAKHVDPRKVLIHMAVWRDHVYDQYYPDYVPSAAAAAYIAHGAKLGFKIAPHMNAMDIDPTNPVYPMLSDFQMLGIDSKTVFGWAYDTDVGRDIGTPWTEYAKMDPRNRRYNIMAGIHTGLSMWHSELYKRMRDVAEKHPVAAGFIDISLCTFNLHNAIVEGRSCTEGMVDMIKMLSEIRGGFPIGGEGLNECTARGLSFAQMHVYEFMPSSSPALARCGGDCAIGDFILGGLCRTIGYSALSGKNEGEYTMLQVYDDHNTIPTIITNDPDELTNPNKFIKNIYERANS